jgi:hypothetical protein
MDAGMTFSRGIADRYFEDYVEGEVHRFGTIAVEADEAIAFAKRFDPQAMHIDPEAAKHTPFGGLIASNWHTAGLMMRLYAEHYLPKAASLGSPGVDELRWLKPVRPRRLEEMSQWYLQRAKEMESRPQKNARSFTIRPGLVLLREKGRSWYDMALD